MKVGIAGLGAMGRNHLRVLQEMGDVEEIVLFDPLIADQSFGVKTVAISSWDYFVGSELDYCVVSSPTSSHREIAGFLGQVGIPCIIEKPLAATSEEAKELVSIFEATNTLGVVGHIERFNPAVVALKNLLASAAIGALYELTTKRIGPFSGRIKDVGVVKDLATHDIDLAMWLSDSRYVEVSAEVSYPLGNLHEDQLVVYGELSGGISFGHEVNWIAASKERTLQIIGDRGEIFVDLLNKTVMLTKTAKDSNGQLVEGVAEHFIEVGDVEPLVAEHRAFQSALSTLNLGNLASLRDGVSVVSVAETFLA